MTTDVHAKFEITPCIGVCQLDEHQVCVGCLRPLDVIVQWRTLNDEQRQEWMNDRAQTDGDQP